MANKYNLYKIPTNNRVPLIQALQEKGFHSTNLPQEIQGYTMDFYLGVVSYSPPSWVTLYQAFIPDSDNISNGIQSATLIIHKEDICYAIALGRAFHIVQRYCDTEFGISLAERIADETYLKEKSSKFFQSKRSKSITSYQPNNPFSFESGESIQFIKARSVDLNKWGKSVEFGVSSQFNLSRDPSYLPELIQEIETLLEQEPVFTLPRTEVIRDSAKIQELDQRIGQAIASTDHTNLSFDDFSISGVDFIFHHSERYSVWVRGRKGETKRTLEDLTMEALQQYIASQNIDPLSEWNNIIIGTERQENEAPYKIKQLIDYVDDENYCLVDGKWQRFNRSYIQYLENIADSIEWTHDPDFDFESGATEPTLIARAVNRGYYAFHGGEHSTQFENKKTRYNVEQMDLFHDRTMYFVKKGKPQKLNYVIDQAINSIRLLQNNSMQIPYNGTYLRPKRVAIWILLTRVNDITKLSDFKSIIFLMKLSDFKKVAQDAGFIPEVHINYIR